MQNQIKQLNSMYSEITKTIEIRKNQLFEFYKDYEGPFKKHPLINFMTSEDEIEYNQKREKRLREEHTNYNGPLWNHPYFEYLTDDEYNDYNNMQEIEKSNLATVKECIEWQMERQKDHHEIQQIQKKTF